MATTTPNYGWSVPTSSDYVAQGAVAIETLGDSVDATLFTALGGAYPGMRLVKKQTIGAAVSSVTVTAAFSATYENYLVLVSGGSSSAANALLGMTLGAASTGYYEVRPRWSIAGAASVFTTNNGNIFYTGMASTNGIKMSCNLMSPFTAKNTTHESGMVNFTTSNLDFSYGYLNDTNSYTAFTLTPTTGTLTGGTVYVYGLGIS
jgi:hypothetical protein